MTNDARSHICIATIGGQAQVVTLALDALFARGVPVSELFVIHLSHRTPRYRLALEQLSGEFVAGRYGGRVCRFQPRAVRIGAQLIDDLSGDAEIRAASDMIHRLIRELKQEDATLHLCISGGRRLLGTLVFSAALLYLDQSDHVWHLYSSDEVRQQTNGGSVLHLPHHPGVRLVEVAFTPWGRFFPLLRERGRTSAAAAYDEALDEADQSEFQRCQQVYGCLTARQREVLRALALDRHPHEIATALGVQPKTVSEYKAAIVEECRIAWALGAEARITPEWLRRKFTPHLDRL
jgi:CRISPR-associated protein Csx14